MRFFRFYLYFCLSFFITSCSHMGTQKDLVFKGKKITVKEEFDQLV